ncbi:hypothetical protein KEM48_004565 [Puccinia striiformis f. sp. tritici PST-130]|nr:hypothetical protein KEM48_004565 [Puccinia striiformis f. sp. tritici PST-130]
MGKGRKIDPFHHETPSRSLWTDHDDGDYDHMLDSQSHLAHHGSLAATSALSAWGSIPWDVPSSIQITHHPNSTSSIQKLLQRPQPRPERYSPKKRRYLAETHAQVVSGVYVAQGEDQNWTATNALDSFSTKSASVELTPHVSHNGLIWWTLLASNA